jgi:hypothetical protein
MADQCKHNWHDLKDNKRMWCDHCMTIRSIKDIDGIYKCPSCQDSLCPRRACDKVPDDISVSKTVPTINWAGGK